MSWLRVNRVTVSVWISSMRVWALTSSRAAEMTAFASCTGCRILSGTADLVSLRDAVSTTSLPNASIAARTAERAS